MEQFEESFVLLIAPKELVKTVKNALESLGKLDKKHKIQPLRSEHDIPQLGFEGTLKDYAGKYFVPTTIHPNGVRTDDRGVKTSVLKQTGLEQHAAAISLATWHPSPPSPNLQSPSPSSLQNPLTQALSTWLHSLPASTLCPTTISTLTTTSRFPYTIYPPLLLLPPTIFTLPPWPSLLPTLTPHLPSLYNLLTTALKVTHIALNAPIPLLRPSTSTPNILRSPTSLTPLYGDFGPALPADQIPSQKNFAEAFWVSARQNSVFQTWAPRYTMFARGNIREKARILRMWELTKEGLGGWEPRETSAVDLYAGIGYFAFSYAKAGVGRVLCWEINGWSVEGLRRGAEGNGWGVQILKGDDVGVDGEERLVVFQESNERAVGRIDGMRDRIPPVRHVNCGFLPSSKGSWETAVQVLDPVHGGWIHAHENIAVKDIESRKKQIVDIFTALAENNHGRHPRRKVHCEHLERVKDYAPGVVHCVLDISITPVAAASG